MRADEPAAADAPATAPAANRGAGSGRAVQSDEPDLRSRRAVRGQPFEREPPAVGRERPPRAGDGERSKARRPASRTFVVALPAHCTTPSIPSVLGTVATATTPPPAIDAGRRSRTPRASRRPRQPHTRPASARNGPVRGSGPDQSVKSSPCGLGASSCSATSGRAAEVEIDHGREVDRRHTGRTGGSAHRADAPKRGSPRARRSRSPPRRRRLRPRARASAGRRRRAAGEAWEARRRARTKQRPRRARRDATGRLSAARRRLF